MSLVLALETATTAVGVAAAGNGVVAERLVVPTRRHTELLFDLVREVLDEVGGSVADLDAVVVDVGPGLFTGLRVGIAAAKGFALASGCGLVGVTSLEVVAHAMVGDGTRVALVDGRRGEVFAATFDAVGSSWQQVGDAMGTTGHALAATLPVGAHVGGDGAHLLADELLAVRPDLVLDAVTVPPAVVALALGVAAFERGEASDPALVTATYLRDADATVNFATRGQR